MSSNQPLSLQSSRPLTYMLPGTNLQDHLSYIDEDITQIKGKVAYMIKMQQVESMSSVNPHSYIDELKMIGTPFIHSDKFMKQVERVKNRANGVQEGKKDNGKGKLIEIDLQKVKKGKLNIQFLRESSKQINSSYITYEQSLLKNISLQTHKQFSPLLLKEMIQSLEQQKSILRNKIEREREQIAEINRLRKYEQLEAREKEDVVGQRIKLMVNKRRKLE